MKQRTGKERIILLYEERDKTLEIISAKGYTIDKRDGYASCIQRESSLPCNEPNLLVLLIVCRVMMTAYYSYIICILPIYILYI